MSQLFHIRNGALSVGSFSGDEVRRLAEDGTLHAGMEIRRLPDGPWAPLSNVKGLRLNAAPVPATSEPLDAILPAEASPAKATASYVAASLAGNGDSPSPNEPQTVQVADILCPFCSEPIKATAKKCKHCGEMLGAGDQRRSSASTPVRSQTMRRSAVVLALAVVALAVVAIGAGVAIEKWKEESERGAKEDAEARKKELEIREVQNAAMQEIFAAEKEARKKTYEREAHSLKISQGAYPDKETLDRLNADADEWQKAIDNNLRVKTEAIQRKAAAEIERIRQRKDGAKP